MTDIDWIKRVDHLLQAIQAQDHQALQALYDLVAGRLLGLSQRILQDKDEAEEVLQDVFIKVWQQSGKYTGRGSAWGWLCVLTRNTTLDHLRKMGKRQYASLEESDSVLEAFINADDAPQAHAIQHCLKKLKQSTRQSVLMSFVYGYSHQELADKLSTPLGTIKTRVRQGLQELKLCLA